MFRKGDIIRGTIDGTPTYGLYDVSVGGPHPFRMVPASRPRDQYFDGQTVTIGFLNTDSPVIISPGYRAGRASVTPPVSLVWSPYLSERGNNSMGTRWLEGVTVANLPAPGSSDTIIHQFDADEKPCYCDGNYLFGLKRTYTCTSDGDMSDYVSTPTIEGNAIGYDATQHFVHNSTVYYCTGSEWYSVDPFSDSLNHIADLYGGAIEYQEKALWPHYLAFGHSSDRVFYGGMSMSGSNSWTIQAPIVPNYPGQPDVQQLFAWGYPVVTGHNSCMTYASGGPPGSPTYYYVNSAGPSDSTGRMLMPSTRKMGHYHFWHYNSGGVDYIYRGGSPPLAAEMIPAGSGWGDGAFNASNNDYGYRIEWEWHPSGGGMALLKWDVYDDTYDRIASRSATLEAWMFGGPSLGFLTDDHYYIAAKDGQVGNASNRGYIAIWDMSRDGEESPYWYFRPDEGWITGSMTLRPYGKFFCVNWRNQANTATYPILAG